MTTLSTNGGKLSMRSRYLCKIFMTVDMETYLRYWLEAFRIKKSAVSTNFIILAIENVLALIFDIVVPS